MKTKLLIGLCMLILLSSNILALDIEFHKDNNLMDSDFEINVSGMKEWRDGIAGSTFQFDKIRIRNDNRDNIEIIKYLGFDKVADSNISDITILRENLIEIPDRIESEDGSLLNYIFRFKEEVKLNYLQSTVTNEIIIKSDSDGCSGNGEIITFYVITDKGEYSLKFLCTSDGEGDNNFVTVGELFIEEPIEQINKKDIKKESNILCNEYTIFYKVIPFVISFITSFLTSFLYVRYRGKK